MAWNRSRDVACFEALGREHFPGAIGVRITDVGEGFLRAEFEVTKNLLTPHGYLHAASVVGLADTAAGYACLAHLPPEAWSFTTMELKCNFIGTATNGTVQCTACAVHLGRTSHVWDATVTAVGQKHPIALFRCTQLILWSPPKQLASV